MNAGMEAEFFLFKPGTMGEATTTTHDVGSYFDLAPADLGEDARRAIVDVLEQMGFEVEAAHHRSRTGSTKSTFSLKHGGRDVDYDGPTTIARTFRFVGSQYVAQAIFDSLLLVNAEKPSFLDRERQRTRLRLHPSFLSVFALFFSATK